MTNVCFLTCSVHVGHSGYTMCSGHSVLNNISFLEFDSSTLPMPLSKIKTFYVTVTEELQLLKILEAIDHEDWCSSMY